MFAPLRPTRGHLRALLRVIVFTWIGNAFIESHGDIAAERGLNFRRDLWRNERCCAVDVILKFNALVRDLAQLRERKDLVPTAIRQNRSVPTHEFVEATQMPDRVEPGPDKQMVGVAKNDLRIHLAQLARTHALYRTLCAHRHECWRIDHAVRSCQAAPSRFRLLISRQQFEIFQHANWRFRDFGWNDKRAANSFCAWPFCLYIRALPHQARQRVCCAA